MSPHDHHHQLRMMCKLLQNITNERAHTILNFNWIYLLPKLPVGHLAPVVGRLR